MTSLREELERIVNGVTVQITDHPQTIRRLKSRHPHSIQHVDECFGRPFNCFAYALGIAESESIYDLLYRDAERRVPLGVKVGAEFVVRLIEKRMLVEDSDGIALVYFRSDRPVHAGILDGCSVISKWGMGHLWNHYEWEVPISYGGKTVRYGSATVSAIEEEFARYAAGLGHTDRF